MRILLICASILMSVSVWGQKKNQKLTEEEMTRMTRDQRIVHETDRKSKHGKKDMSLKKRVKTAKKQDKRSEHIKQPKRKKTGKKKS